MLSMLRSRRGEGYVDVVVMVLCSVMVLALAVSVLPVFVSKYKLDSFANELCREAEIEGIIGTKTSVRERALNEKMGISPTVRWSKSGRIQINEEFSVTCELPVNIGFGPFGAFPIRLRAVASGKSEVYHK